jgi:hypothetical protein
VAIANPFAVARYELTFDEWDACAAHGYCDPFVNDNGWGRGLLISMDNRANERTESREVSCRQFESHSLRQLAIRPFPPLSALLY